MVFLYDGACTQGRHTFDHFSRSVLETVSTTVRDLSERHRKGMLRSIPMVCNDNYKRPPKSRLEVTVHIRLSVPPYFDVEEGGGTLNRKLRKNSLF